MRKTVSVMAEAFVSIDVEPGDDSDIIFAKVVERLQQRLSEEPLPEVLYLTIDENVSE